MYFFIISLMLVAMSKDTKITQLYIDQELADQIVEEGLFEKYNIECSARLLGALDYFIESGDEETKTFILENKSFQELFACMTQNTANTDVEAERWRDSYSLDNLLRIKNHLSNMPEYKEGF